MVTVPAALPYWVMVPGSIDESSDRSAELKWTTVTPRSSSVVDWLFGVESGSATPAVVSSANSAYALGAGAVRYSVSVADLPAGSVLIVQRLVCSEKPPFDTDIPEA